jgi:putative acetyltransferase
VIVRPERTGDASDRDAIGAVHAAAFRRSDAPGVPIEVPLVAALRAGEEWLPRLSLVALVDGAIVGHVVCSRGWVTTPDGDRPALGLGPLGVRPEHQGAGIGAALVHTVLGAADALDESLVALLGEPGYYRRFGFEPATAHGIEAPDPGWGDYFQVRLLAAHRPGDTGPFRYAAPFGDL